MSTSTPSDPLALDRLRDAIGSGDAARVASCFTADFRAELPQHPERNFVGTEQVRANWSAIFDRTPHLTARVLRTAVNGAEIWSEWEMADIDKPGAPVVFAGPVILTTRDGKINWVRFYLDPVGPTPD
ncbi:nuclear transport factor 2 family protein [Mycobacterium sp. NPDC003449]